MGSPKGTSLPKTGGTKGPGEGDRSTVLDPCPPLRRRWTGLPVESLSVSLGSVKTGSTGAGRFMDGTLVYDPTLPPLS